MFLRAIEIYRWEEMGLVLLLLLLTSVIDGLSYHKVVSYPVVATKDKAMHMLKIY